VEVEGAGEGSRLECSGDSETEETALNSRLAVDRALTEVDEVGVTGGVELTAALAEEER
jgi:hypothetical protein